MRRRRWQRWVVIGVVLAFGLYLVADVVMVQYLESRGGAEIARTMAAEDVTLELGGFPFIPRYLSGKLSGVSARVNGASAKGGLRIQSTEADAAKLAFSAGDLFSLARSIFATRSEIAATDAFVRLQLQEGDINDYIRRQIPVVGDVQVKASGIEVRFLVEGIDPSDAAHPAEDDLTEPARLIPAVRDRKFYLSLLGVSRIPTNFRAEAERLEELIDLPRFPEGLSPTVKLSDDVLVVEAQGAEVKVKVGEGTPT